MLGCPCKMIKPVTFATAKKSTCLRYGSFARNSLGCYCYDMKRIILLHEVKRKYVTKRVLDNQNIAFKESKNFISTSFKFWNASDEKTPLKSGETPEIKFSEKKIKVVNDESKKVLDDNGTNIASEEKKEKCTDGDKLEQQNYSTHGSTDGKFSKINDSSVNSGKEKIEKFVSETIALSDYKKKIPGITIPVSGIDTKVLVKPAKKNGTKVSELEISKIGTKSTDNDEVKRQMYELNLGKLEVDKFEDPPNVSIQERAVDEIQMKEGSQKFFEKAKSILLKTTTVGKSEETNRNVKAVCLGEAKGNLNVNPTRRRQTVDLNRSSTERNFITPVRAMTDFLLKPSDLEGLRKTKRRSPYENDPPITVYWRKDVEAKAIDIWGSKENLLKEILKRDIERRRYQQNLFTVKRRLRDYRREQGRESEFKLEKDGLWGSSGKVVLTAIAINGANFLCKLIAWVYTGSHSMFSEAIHSLADTINQLILAYGIHKSVQRADSDHPYGYTNMRYVASLISGVGIFCVGSGLSFYHGVVGLTEPSDIESFYWAYYILWGSLGSEGGTLLVAFNSIRRGALKSGMSLSEYVYRGQDPSVNVVLLEDAAAVVGVAIAGVCMGLSSYFDSHVPDAIGSFLVGGLLASVASFIIYTNVAALVGRSIPQERLDKINAVLESDVMIRAIHDVKGIDIGNSLVRYKAEMDFDGGELTRSYLDKQDLNQMLEEVKKFQTIDELEEFMLKHGENIVDMMGGEIDRIELKLRVRNGVNEFQVKTQEVLELTRTKKLVNLY